MTGVLIKLVLAVFCVAILTLMMYAAEPSNYQYTSVIGQLKQ